MDYYIIVCVDNKNGIGKDGIIPWEKLKEDMLHFTNKTTKVNDLTKQNAVIMGRITWNSIPERFKPLKNRFNIIISKNININQNNILVCNNLYTAINIINNNIEKIFIIGGELLYKEALDTLNIKKIYLTKIINKNFNCDKFFPDINLNYYNLKKSKTFKQNDIEYNIETYVKF